MALKDHLLIRRYEQKSLKKHEFKDISIKNELDKFCIPHDIAYEDFKDLPRGTPFDKVICDKAFSIAKNQKYDKYQRGIVSVVYEFFHKKSSNGAFTRADKSAIKREIIPNQQLTGELHNPIIKKLEKRKVSQYLGC